jgi:PhnB protein
MDDDADVRAVIAARLEATGAKDAAGSLAAFAEDVVVFDLPPPLAQPSEEMRDPARAQTWFDTWDGPIDVDLRELVVRAEGDLAFAHGLLHMAGRRRDGSEGDFWSRTTICLERRDGAWRIVHEHNSFPMRMDGSGLAATDLNP